MTIILRTPEIATAKRVLVAQRKAAEPASLDSSPVPEANVDFERSEQHSTKSDLEVQEQLLDTGEEEVLQSAESVRKNAYDEGYELGLRNGEAEGREAYTSGLQQLESLTHNLNGTIQSGLEETEDLVVAIVYEAVCKIVGDALATREGVVAVVKEAMSRVRGKSSVIIRVNPFDLELIEEGAAFGVASETDWRGDESIPMGGCVIESEYGTLDARIDTQLNQLKRVLLAARHKPAGQSENKPTE